MAIPILIRQVWACNLDEEFTNLGNLIDKFPFVSMDTEFPGTIVKTPKSAPPSLTYDVLRRNVDSSAVIQVGLTLSDASGNLPFDDKGKNHYNWQFNFGEFHPSRDKHDADSIALLVRQGINFDTFCEEGVDSLRFGELMMSSGLVCNDSDVTWVTFHCCHDFAYLVKILTQRRLPNDLAGFDALVRLFFGEKVFDVKYMIRFCDGLYGGLDRVGETLGVRREVGSAHLAGSDSLLTWRVFQRIRDRGHDIDWSAGKMYGLAAVP